MVDYTTQKPDALVKGVIEGVSIVNINANLRMLVADFFGGSGVTSIVAHNLGRKFIHVDIGINSMQTLRDRLRNFTKSKFSNFRNKRWC